MYFLNLPQKIFFYFVVFDQFDVVSLIPLLYWHKNGEYMNKDHSFRQNTDQKKESDK